MNTFMNLMISRSIFFSPSLCYLQAHLKHLMMLLWPCMCVGVIWPFADRQIRRGPKLIRPVFGASLFYVVYYNNKFYSVTVDAWGRVFTYNIGGPNSTLTYHHVTMLLKELAEACGCCLKQLYWNHQALCC